jgi:hypothetical protein
VERTASPPQGAETGSFSSPASVAPGEILACSGEVRRMPIFRLPVQGLCSCSSSCPWPLPKEDADLVEEEIRSLQPVQRGDAAPVRTVRGDSHKIPYVRGLWPLLAHRSESSYGSKSFRMRICASSKAPHVSPTLSSSWAGNAHPYAASSCHGGGRTGPDKGRPSRILPIYQRFRSRQGHNPNI